MPPETYLSWHLGGKVGFFVDFTPSAALLPSPQGEGLGLWSKGFNLEVQTHHHLTVVKVHFYVPWTYCVLLGNSSRKHIVKGGCQWAHETRESESN